MSAKVAAAFNHFREYYSDAFADDVRAVWHGVPSISEDAEAVDSMCYYRALRAFYDNDDTARVWRRRLLYAYLANDYDTQDAKSTLNVRKQTLPIKSSVRKVLRNIATAYNEAPRRTFSDNESVQSAMSDIYNRMGIDSVMRSLYHRARLFGVVAVRPLYVGGSWYMDVLTPDEFRVASNPEHWREVVAMTYPIRGTDRHGKPSVNYVTWSALARTETDASGAIVSQLENPYGVLPFVFLRLESDASTFFSGGMIDLVDANLDANKFRFISSLNATFNGSPVWIGTNLQNIGRVSFSPDQIMNFENVKVGEGLPLPPTLDSVSPEPTYSDLDEYARTRMRDAMHDEGVPPSMTGTESADSLPSGIARVIERQEIIEQRLADTEQLRKFEFEFARMAALTARVDAGVAIDENAVTCSVDYSEERVIIEPEKEYAADKQKVADGVMSVAAFWAKWSGEDAEQDEDAVLSVMEQRRTQAQLVGFVPTGTDGVDG